MGRRKKAVLLAAVAVFAAWMLWPRSLAKAFDAEQGLWYGRTYADSVEVAGHVYFAAADNEPAEGEFVSVLITESLGPDLLGVRQKEA